MTRQDFLEAVMEQIAWMARRDGENIPSDPYLRKMAREDASDMEAICPADDWQARFATWCIYHNPKRGRVTT